MSVLRQWLVSMFIFNLFSSLIKISLYANYTALHPIPGAVIYTSTKFAVQGFVQALYEEIRQEGYGDVVHCTTVHPYFVSTRNDLMAALNLRFPAVTVNQTANETVNAMLRNEQQVAIPRLAVFLTSLIRSLSFKNQQLFRDYILKENEIITFRNNSLPLSDVVDQNGV